LFFRVGKDSMMSAMHFKAPGRLNRILLPFLFPVVYSLMRNACSVVRWEDLGQFGKSIKKICSMSWQCWA
jgi:hypothetical protein